MNKTLSLICGWGKKDRKQSMYDISPSSWNSDSELSNYYFSTWTPKQHFQSRISTGDCVVETRSVCIERKNDRIASGHHATPTDRDSFTPLLSPKKGHWWYIEHNQLLWPLYESSALLSHNNELQYRSLSYFWHRIGTTSHVLLLRLASQATPYLILFLCFHSPIFLLSLHCPPIHLYLLLSHCVISLHVLALLLLFHLHLLLHCPVKEGVILLSISFI